MTLPGGIGEATQVCLVTIPHSNYCEAARWALTAARVQFIEIAFLLRSDEPKHITAVPRIRAADDTMLARLKDTIPVGGFEGRPSEQLEQRKSTTMVPVATVHGQRTLLGDSFEICAYAVAAPGSMLSPLSSDSGWAAKMDLFGAACRNLSYVLLSPAHAADLQPMQLANLCRKFYCPVGDDAFADTVWGARTDVEIRNFTERMGVGFRAQDSSLMIEAVEVIEGMFDTVQARLATTGQPARFLGGELLGIDDIMFASHASFILFPPEFGAGICTRWPAVDELPEKYRQIACRLRDHEAGKHALRLYAQNRHHGMMPTMLEPEPQTGVDFALSLLEPPTAL